MSQMPKHVQDFLNELKAKFPEMEVIAQVVEDDEKTTTVKKDVIIDGWYNATKQQMITNPPYNKLIQVKQTSDQKWMNGVIVGKTMDGIYLIQSNDKSDKSIYKAYPDKAIFRPFEIVEPKKSVEQILAEKFKKDMNNLFNTYRNNDFDSEEELEDALSLAMIKAGWTKK